MVMTSLIKDKRNFSQVKKKRINWSQSLNTTKAFALTFAQYKKSLQYILLLKKLSSGKNFDNLHLLQAFITRYGKIKPRRKTRILPRAQRAISKAIKKARSFGIIPYTCSVSI